MSLAAPVVAQDDTRYRIEILVLTHLDSQEEPQERLRLTDYSTAVDFLTPPPEESDEMEDGESATEAMDESAEPIGESTGETPETVDLTVEEAAEAEDPNRLVHVEEMSGTMEEAWRRLRLSGPFRPEQYLSWEQGSSEPFPVLRIHDLEAVMIDDPWAELRAELLEQAMEEESLESTGTVFADAAGLEAMETDDSEEPGIPDPIYHYRLDGTAALKRSRFLHLELDLQLREPVWNELTRPVPNPSDDAEQPALPSSFRVHELKQRRQVRTERLEYFDGPVLGVLALITEVEEEDGNSP